MSLEKDQSIELLKECVVFINTAHNTKFMYNNKETTSYKLASKIEKFIEDGAKERA